jgi:hypothetical protein
MNENMKKMDDPHFKNVIIFILFIFILFFVSNDKNFNKIFQKNIVKILFVITLVYMAYLKINICFILAIFFLFILFNTNIGKKLQKNRYIKRILKLLSPYVNPLIYAIEDFIASFTEIPDDESSIGSTRGSHRVRFDDEKDFDLDDMDDIDQVDDLEFNDSKSKNDKDKNKNINYDILDEIRNDMNLSIPSSQDETPLHQNNDDIDCINDIDGIDDDDGEELKPDAILDHNDVKKLYQELASVKDQLSNIE